MEIFSYIHPDEFITYTKSVFPGGEVHIRLDNPEALSLVVTIRADIKSSEDVMELLMITDAIRRANGSTEITLVCPYFPYARQDRVCADGEALSVKVFADLINSQHYHQVITWDAHSDVTPALINNNYNAPLEDFIRDIDLSNVVLVAPDAGAIKKVSRVSKRLGSPFVRADKTRSVVDGSITGTVVYSEHIGTKDFLIVDDICDGGRTFIELAKALRPLTSGKVMLYITHGIFSKGLNVFDGLIDKIYVANPFFDVASHPNYEVV